MKLNGPIEHAIYAAAFVRRLTSPDGVPPDWRGDREFVARQEAADTDVAMTAANACVRLHREAIQRMGEEGT